MGITTPKELAKYIEGRHDVGCWRFSWITPANKSKTNKKQYHYEYPAMTSEAIRGGGKGRGFETQPKDFPDAYKAVSIYLKYVEDLYVIDFDDKSKCNVENELWDLCRSLETVQIETVKGSHFYFYITDLPSFTCSTKLQFCDSYGDIDLLGRKKNGQMNVVERCSHKVSESDMGGFPEDIKTVNWKDFEPFFNITRMSGSCPTKKEKEMAKKATIADKAISGGSGDILDEEKFVGYLERLDKVSRYHYEDWFKVGCICYNNWEDKDIGFSVWLSWTNQDPNKATEHPHRTMEVLMGKWASMGNHPEPVKWQTLRNMANVDDKSLNPFQELYDVGGEEAVVGFMNEYLFFNRETSETIMIDPEDTTDLCKFSVKKDSDAKLIFRRSKIFVADAKKPINPYDIWVNSPLQLQVCRVVFDPRPSCPRNVFNIWKGFDIDEKDLDRMSLPEANALALPLLEHLRLIWCKGNMEYYQYLMSWFAFILQRPGTKVGVLLVAKSKEGAGKGIVYDFMRTILGKNLYAQINSIKQVVEDFNVILEGKLFINCDEAHWGGEIKSANKMKGLITETEVWINDKYRKSYQIHNTTAFAFASNEDRATSAREGDRRHFGLELDNKWAGKQKTEKHKKYFQDISGEKMTGVSREKAEAFAKVLFNWDITNFNVRNPPNTDYIDEQFERNWTPIQKWWHGILYSGQFSIKDSFKRDTWERDGETQTKIPYDLRQLEWGHILPDGSNGSKKVSSEYHLTPNALTLVLSLGDTRLMAGAGVFTKWREWCEDCGFEWGDINYMKLPIPQSFIRMLDYSPQEHLNLRRITPYPVNLKKEGEMPFIPFRGNPDDKEWFYRDMSLVADFDTLSLVELSKRHLEFIRVDGEGFCGTRVDEEGWEGGKASYITNQLEMTRYLAKWGDGVNGENFREDAMVKSKWMGLDRELCQWEREDCQRVYYYEKTKRVFHHLYDKSWVWNKYTEGAGSLGYGASCLDSGAFWKDIKCLMGGDKKDGGRLVDVRTKSDGVRRTMIEVPTIADLRGKFEKWTGRRVDWGDTEEVELDDPHQVLPFMDSDNEEDDLDGLE